MPLGTITSVQWRLGSGIATIHFKDGTQVHAEAGPTLRALADAFGSLGKANQQSILYEVDDLGILKSFLPVDAPPPTPQLGRSFP